MDPMMLAALSMDPKTLQAMGIDPKKLNTLAQPATSKSGDSKTKANSTLDPMLLAAFGMDPENPKLDPITAAALGHDPKNPKFDPMLDPKKTKIKHSCSNGCYGSKSSTCCYERNDATRLPRDAWKGYV